jgi:hypothetical protein
MERPIAFTLLALPLVWVAALIIPTFPRAEWLPVLLTWGICVILGLVSTLRMSYLPDWGWGIIGGLVAVAIGTSFISSLGPDFACGLLLGLPWVVVGYVARPTESLGLRFTGFGAVTIWGLILLGTSAQLGLPTGTVHGRDLLAGLLALIADQGQVLGGLVTGSPTPSVPLLNFFDPVFAALTAVSMLGLMLVTVRPQTGQGSPLPIAIQTHRALGAGRSLPPSYGFTSIQQAVFFERSAVEPPLTAWPPGLASVVCGASAAGAFLAMAYFAPLWAILGATVAAAVAVVFLAVEVEAPGVLRLPIPPRARRSRRAATMTPPRSPAMLTQPSMPVADPGTAPPASEP